MYDAQAVMNRVCWHRDAWELSGVDAFKIPKEYIELYVQKAVDDHPMQFLTFFKR